jgi:hypothetical protein
LKIKNLNRNFNFDKITVLPKENVRRHYSSEKHVCSTCKTEIGSEISRIMITNDIDGSPRLFCFHFFFPCWDMRYFCQKYQNLTIERAGFSIPENITIKEKSMKDLQKNLEYWK